VLLPLGFYEQATRYNNDGGIEAIEVLAAKKQQLKLVRFRGKFRILPEVATDAGGFQGILLPAGATVFVHNLFIEFWGRPKGPLPVTVVLARGITIGGEAVEHRLRIRLESKTGTAESFFLSDSWHTADGGEVPAAVMRTGQFLIPDVLAKRCHDQAQQPGDAEQSSVHSLGERWLLASDLPSTSPLPLLSFQRSFVLPRVQKAQDREFANLARGR
jgi:hypothetical protein